MIFSPEFNVAISVGMHRQKPKLAHMPTNVNQYFRIRMSFIARYVYTYEEFVFMTEATAVQQNDSDRTKNR